MKKALLIYSLLLALITCAAGDLAAQQASAQVTYKPVTGGYRYFFTIANETSESDGYHLCSLDAILSGCTDIYAPGIWYGGLTGVSAYWEVPSVPYGWRQGVGPGESLGGFAVTAPNLVEKVRYRIVWSNETSGSSVFGYAYPTPVPETSALMGLMGGLGALGLPILRGKRKA